jgi:hypothetical protein
MTRYLVNALGAQQPLFGQSIEELERASGRPSADIRLSSEIMTLARQKITALGLDPNDTTATELYGALQARMRDDEQRVRQALGIPEAAAVSDILSRVQNFVNNHKTTKTCFALKATAAKRLLKKRPPKNAMKQLGYRSLDSLLKHESMATIYAAAVMAEAPSWHRAFRAQYDHLSSADFEQRKIIIMFPKAERWAEASASYVENARHNILCFKELGTVVLLPFAAQVEGLAITSLLFTLYYLNDIRSYSSYMKLQQVKPDFGAIVRVTTDAEPMTTATLAGQAVPWKVIQRYYGRQREPYHPEVFEPHVQPDDLKWHDGETIVAELEPALAFWQDTQYVCAVQGEEPVSCNILDVALSYCNHLSFGDRIVHFAREHLWHELMSRYLHQENLEAAVHQQLSRELIDETALALEGIDSGS